MSGRSGRRSVSRETPSREALDHIDSERAERLERGEKIDDLCWEALAQLEAMNGDDADEAYIEHCEDEASLADPDKMSRVSEFVSSDSLWDEHASVLVDFARVGRRGELHEALEMLGVESWSERNAYWLYALRLAKATV